MDDSQIIEKPKKRVGISNLKTKKKSNKPEFGLYHPNSGIPAYFPDPDAEPEDQFRINLSRVFCRRSDFIKAKLESQPHKPKAEEPDLINSGEPDLKIRTRIGTKNEEELEAISKSFAGDTSNPFKVLMMGARSKSIIDK